MPLLHLKIVNECATQYVACEKGKQLGYDSVDSIFTIIYHFKIIYYYQIFIILSSIKPLIHDQID